MDFRPYSPLESSAQVRIHWTRDTAVVSAMTGMRDINWHKEWMI